MEALLSATPETPSYMIGVSENKITRVPLLEAVAQVRWPGCCCKPTGGLTRRSALRPKPLPKLLKQRTLMRRCRIVTRNSLRVCNHSSRARPSVTSTGLRRTRYGAVHLVEPCPRLTLSTVFIAAPSNRHHTVSTLLSRRLVEQCSLTSPSLPLRGAFTALEHPLVV